MESKAEKINNVVRDYRLAHGGKDAFVGCIDCGVNVREWGKEESYMVQDDIWEAAHPESYGMLCIVCLERRLGRKLEPKDFPDVPANMDFQYMSDRLLDRLGKSK